MPTAASIATAMPKNLSGVIAVNKPAIHSTTPSCELNSRALIAADATPIKINMRMNRNVKKLSISALRFAWWAHWKNHPGRCGAVHRLHAGGWCQSHNETLGLAVDREQSNAAFRHRVWNRDALRLVRDDEWRRFISARPKTHGASRGIARRGSDNKSHRNPAFPGIRPRLLTSLGTERRDGLRDFLRRDLGNRRRRGHTRRKKPAACGSQ